ncbi:MAG: hypothetical protein IPP94_13645 [Ignavibacteria bacterium]|nr:hypothetical protein [Ignavibacteria bacterium]
MPLPRWQGVALVDFPALSACSRSPMAVYGAPPTWARAVLHPALMLLSQCAFGLSVWFSAL